MPEKKKYDIVIIGSGLGGLFCGALLASQGKRVCVLEKHGQPGGNLQTFKRKGCSFSAGMHYGGSLDKGQVLYKIFNYFGIYKSLNFKKLDEDCFDKIIIGDKEYCYAMGMDNFRNTLLKYFPDERKAIDKYVDKLTEIWNSSDLINLREVNFNRPPDFEKYRGNAYDFIDSLTDNEDLKAVLAGTNGLYAGNKEKTTLYLHANINTFFINSAWRIASEGEQLTGSLIKIITGSGGDVLTGKEAVKFTFKDDIIHSVKVISGEEYTGENFISAIHPVLTFRMLGKGKLRKVYVDRINNLENSVSAFVLFVVLKKNRIRHINSNIYYSETKNVWDNYNYTEHSWPRGYMMYTTEDKQNKGFAESMVVISMMKFSDVEKWKDTTVMNRGHDYEQFKKGKSRKLMNLVSVRFPDIAEAVDTVYSATPLTLRDYTGTVDGSMYGIIKDCNDPLGTFLSPKTRVPNLFLTGQNIGTHGLLGVIMTAFQTCASFMDINKLIREIRDHEEEI